MKIMGTRFPGLALLAALLLAPVHGISAGTAISSHFGFPVDLPDDWFVVGPDTVSKANASETTQTLGIPEIADVALLGDIMEKVKSGKIEFYYDKKYLDREFKNHVSVQLASPITFGSAEELKAGMDEQCSMLPGGLHDIYGEEVNIHSCRIVALNKQAVLHHAYTLPSQGLTIINEQIPINDRYSIVFVGGSGNDVAGLHRVRQVQQQLVESLIRFLAEQTHKAQLPKDSRPPG